VTRLSSMSVAPYLNALRRKRGRPSGDDRVEASATRRPPIVIKYLLYALIKDYH
jgi:hypothetical protein